MLTLRVTISLSDKTGWTKNSIIIYPQTSLVHNNQVKHKGLICRHITEIGEATSANTD